MLFDLVDTTLLQQKSYKIITSIVIYLHPRFLRFHESRGIPSHNKMPAAVAVNGPTPVQSSTPEVNGAAATTTMKKQKLTKNQMKRERKKQKKAAEKQQQESQEADVTKEDEADGGSVSPPHPYDDLVRAM